MASGGKSPRTKGFTFEREIVNTAREAGVGAERARGSDGRALGENQEVDIRFEGPYTAQCKRMKTVSKKYLPSSEVDLQIFRADREGAYVTMRLNLFLALVRGGPTSQHTPETTPTK